MTEIKVTDICEKAKYASNQFLAVSAKEKNVLLETIRDLIYANIEELKEVNKLDLSQGEKSGLTTAFLDRLKLTDARIQTMCNGINDVTSY